MTKADVTSLAGDPIVTMTIRHAPALYDRAEAAYQDGVRSDPRLVAAGNAFHDCLAQIEYGHSLPQHVKNAIVIAAATQFREDADALYAANAA